MVNDHDTDDGNKPPEDVKPEPAPEPAPEPPPVVEPESVAEGPVDDRITNLVAQFGALQAQFESFRAEVQEKLGAVEGIATMAAELTIVAEAVREIKETDQKPEKENWLTKKWIG